MVDRYALIVGIGRSGTNWLYDLLNLSAETHCRNATQFAVPSSPLAPLIAGVAPAMSGGEFGLRWDEAITAMSGRMGRSDGRIPVRKSHFHPWAHRLGLVRAAGSQRLRPLLAIVQPSLRQQEWPVPSWLGSKRALQQAVLVLRTGPTLSCLEWVLAHRQQAVVLHMVRHPGGFLNSWLRRFLAVQDIEEVRRNNAERLEMMLQVDDSWAERFGDIHGMSAQESELWAWRFSAETTWKIGREHSRYKLVTFESLAFALKSTLRSVYDHCGLAWSEAVAEAASRMPSHFSGKMVSARDLSETWRGALDPADIALVDRVLEGSPLRQLWA